MFVWKYIHKILKSTLKPDTWGRLCVFQQRNWIRNSITASAGHLDTELHPVAIESLNTNRYGRMPPNNVLVP